MLRCAARSLVCSLVIVTAVAASSAPALGAQGYGGAAGVALPLSPTAQPGVALALSATLTGLEETAPGILLLRGEVLGLITAGAKAIMPTLTGEVGVSAGPLDLFLSGGVQIFGVNWRGDWTFFNTFGLLGGGGLRLRITDTLQLEARGGVTWLPEFAAAKLREPVTGDIPTLLWFQGLLGVVYTPAWSAPSL